MLTSPVSQVDGTGPAEAPRTPVSLGNVSSVPLLPAEGPYRRREVRLLCRGRLVAQSCCGKIQEKISVTDAE